MDPIEAEIDAIRQQIYEETKHMTTEERLLYLKQNTDPIIKQFHMKVSSLKPIEPRKPQVDEPYYLS